MVITIILGLIIINTFMYMSLFKVAKKQMKNLKYYLKNIIFNNKREWEKCVKPYYVK